MNYTIGTQRKPLSIVVHIKSKSPQTIRIVGWDAEKRTHDRFEKEPRTFFIDRECEIYGYRKIELPLPQSPRKLRIAIYNKRVGNRPNDRSFVVEKFDILPLKTWLVWQTPETQDFVQFAKQFAENASILSAGIYGSDKGGYKIKYLPVIRNRENGKVLTTPARISNASGIIEVSKSAFLEYTVAMRMVILLHEYSHYYLNKVKRDEVQADLNALYIYLGLGYSRIEAHKAFLTVFSNSNSVQNDIRYEKIKDYIDKFERGEIAQPHKGQLKMIA